MKISALNHDCEKYGCAKKVLDPKLRTFDGCFNGKIRIGDIDGAVERKGHILWIEWKRGGNLATFDTINFAQVKMAREFCRNSDKQAFVFVIGDPVDMVVRYFRVMWRGEWHTKAWIKGDTDRFREFLKYWYARADADKPLFEKEGGEERACA
jgi:hypothetical protein